MPRMTRAAMRNVVYEGAENAAEIPLPSTPQRSQAERAPLGEIVLNTQEEPRVVLEINFSKPVKKATKGKGGKKASKPDSDKENMSANEASAEVIEDDTQSTTSSAVELACRDLLSSPGEYDSSK